MKIGKVLCVFSTLLLLSVLVMPISVFASESGGTTTLTTTVPDTHTVNLVIEGNGTVKAGNQEYKNSQTIHVGRLSEQVYQLIPDKDWQLDKVMYGTKDAMGTADVKDDMFTAPMLNHDGNTLKVVFMKKADTTEQDTPDKGEDKAEDEDKDIDKDKDKDKDKKNGGIKTGDAANLMIWGALLAVSATAIYGLNQKRKIND